ncbi:uncharacterized protein [Cherax quadricarinatus]|uniref:uncharacterized protein n=1 Tax=Cherax quadricarinatus TaxID=27406 RepID=UPI00387E9155
MPGQTPSTLLTPRLPYNEDKMRVGIVALVLVLACWTTVKSVPFGGPLVGLIALKALLAVKLGSGLVFGKRSVDDPAQEEEKVLLSSVSEVDQDGCIRKMLCQLQTKEETSRTLEEKLLTKLFTNSNEKITSYNAAFVYATDIGKKTRNAAVCKKVFNKCTLSDAELNDLLQKTWGCGFDFPEESVSQ